MPTDTPVTNGARRVTIDTDLPKYVVPADIAERLERERDAARADRDAWKESCAQYHRANESLDKDRSALMAALRRVLSSAHPHPVENPAMHEAWEDARCLLPENAKLSHEEGGKEQL